MNDKTSNTEKEISQVLSDAAKDILTEDTQKEIETLFESKVEETAKERIELSTKAALLEMDQRYKEELEKLVESIDSTHANKIEQLSEKFEKKFSTMDRDYAKKLIQVKEHYEAILEKDSKEFKKSVMDAVEDYINEHVDTLIPQAQIQEAVANKQSKMIVEEIRKLVSVNSEYVHEDVKNAMKDAKRQIEESSKENAKLKKQMSMLQESLEKTNTEVLLESKCSKFSKEKAKGIKTLLEGKSAEYIQKNFDYVVGLYEKKEQKEIQNIRESVKGKGGDVDTEALKESTKRVISEKSSSESVDPMDEYESMLGSFGHGRYGQ